MGGCVKCMSRVPYATLIATIMCCVGVGVFCGTMYKGAALTLRMLKDVFGTEYKWLGNLQLIFVILGSVMGFIGLLLLFVGFLATGSTREKIYRGWRSRLGGRISCVIFMIITYFLKLAWLLILCCLIAATLCFTLFFSTCRLPVECINLELFYFLYPNGTKPEKMKICGQNEKAVFCRDYVEPAEIMYVLASVSNVIVVISLIHYLMCLAANYTHIKEQEKYQDLQELQYLQESELGTLPKERF